MGLLSKIANLRMKIFLWVGLPVIAAIGLLYGSTDLVPAWQAKSGSGTVGTFTAEREECGKRSCSFHGSWTSKDGSKSLPDVILYDEPDSLRLDGTTEAIDSGARKGVFATAGGSTYLLVTALTVGGVLAAVGWVYFLFRTFTRRREQQPA
jgi:hypothetical protein